MNTVNPTPTSPLVLMHDTVVGRFLSHFVHHEPSMLMRILLIVIVGVLVFIAVRMTRRFSEWLAHRSRTQESRRVFVTRQPKLLTVTRLVASGIAFFIYFFAFGLLLQEFGVNLTAYLVSASIVGLAISFGSQGLVQDVVIGLTMVFSDTMDVGDLVEITGNTTVIGRVEEIGLRFTRLINFYDQVILIPNRSLE
jgi:small conductance mechanosensitive channel